MLAWFSIPTDPLLPGDPRLSEWWEGADWILGEYVRRITLHHPDRPLTHRPYQPERDDDLSVPEILDEDIGDEDVVMTDRSDDEDVVMTDRSDDEDVVMTDRSDEEDVDEEQALVNEVRPSAQQLGSIDLDAVAQAVGQDGGAVDAEVDQLVPQVVVGNGVRLVSGPPALGVDVVGYAASVAACYGVWVRAGGGRRGRRGVVFRRHGRGRRRGVVRRAGAPDGTYRRHGRGFRR